jgi:peptide/nickel transport system substrate-binding protein
MNGTSTSNVRRSRLLAGAGVLLALFLGWAASDHAAQDPPKQRMEEGEDPPAKGPKRKIRFEEEDPDAKPARPGANPSADLAQLAREAKNPHVQQLYRKLAVPYDYVDRATSEKELPKYRAQPLEQLYGKNRAKLFGTINYVPLDDDGKPGKPVSDPAGIIRSIQPYELIALSELDKFRKQGLEKKFPDGVSLYEQLVAEEQVLSAVLRFHESAKAARVRKGDDWGDVEGQLRARLLDVLLGQLDAHTAAKDWNAAFAVATRVTDAFPGDADQLKIAPHVVELLREALAENQLKLNINAGQLRDAHRRLRALMERFPDNPQIKGLRTQLEKQAQKLYDAAQDVGKSGKPADLARAQELLREAEELWPQLDGLQKLRAEMRQKYPILRVGVRELPQLMSPHTAVTDPELRAVEMLFEGLVKFTPDGPGRGRYEPALAEGRPQVIELGRSFRLPGNVLWSDDQPLTLDDIKTTLQAVRDGRGPGHSLAWQNLLAPEREVTSGGGRDGFRINVHLNKGYIEPLALMNAKIVPRWALKPGQEDGEAFGAKPVGSGPFVYAGRRSEQGRNFAAFLPNPNYSARPSKSGMPRFREVRFYTYTNALEEVRNNVAQLSILLDLTADEAAQLREERGKNHYTVKLPAANEPNRRVYFLAVNHRRAPLDDKNLRGALSLAINREKLLDDHYRGKLKREVHKALNGPYPARSWACDPKLVSRADKNSQDPFDPIGAKAKFAAAADKLPRGQLALTLKFPAGDKALADAMNDLAAQVQELLGVKIEPVPVPARALRDAVETTGDFELAYCHFDFADDTYWLGPLFGPKRRPDGEVIDNAFGFKNDDLRRLLEESVTYREFAEVQKCTRAIHRLLAREETPVVPLWQLDPLHAVRESVQAPPFDAQRVFTDIEKWRLDRNAD